MCVDEPITVDLVLHGPRPLTLVYSSGFEDSASGKIAAPAPVTLRLGEPGATDERDGVASEADTASEPLLHTLELGKRQRAGTYVARVISLTDAHGHQRTYGKSGDEEEQPRRHFIVQHRPTAYLGCPRDDHALLIPDYRDLMIPVHVTGTPPYTLTIVPVGEDGKDGESHQVTIGAMELLDVGKPAVVRVPRIGRYRLRDVRDAVCSGVIRPEQASCPHRLHRQANGGFCC